MIYAIVWPMPTSSREVTALLIRWREGEPEAFDRLMPLVYDELQRLAHVYLRHERAQHTLNTTALVHEAYLSLLGQEATPWQNRTHFFAVAARAMRHILIDYARRRNRAKRGGGQFNLTLEENVLVSEDHLEDLLALDQAMTQLETVDARLCRIVECRYFGGLTIAETAEALALSPATVKRDWNLGKAWLHRALFGESARKTPDP
ncbi:MAG: sigma-70 family RNA polymerase sigma factor [Rhodothermales bacterium]